MIDNNQMPSGPAFVSGNSSMASRITIHGPACDGECLAEARSVYERAMIEAKPLAGHSQSDIDKRFQFLYDVSATDKHKEAEILLENALALYEALYGQEDPTVAQLLLDLAQLHTLHGNADAAQYLQDWAKQILATPKEEPVHEFFNLFGMNEPTEEEAALWDKAQDPGNQPGAGH